MHIEYISHQILTKHHHCISFNPNPKEKSLKESQPKRKVLIVINLYKNKATSTHSSNTILCLQHTVIFGTYPTINTTQVRHPTLSIPNEYSWYGTDVLSCHKLQNSLLILIAPTI